MNIETTTTSSDLLEDLLLKKVDIKNDWKIIKEKFNQIYPFFFIEYIKKGVQLTAKEEQLLLLEKIGFNTKTIASFFNVFPESVHKSRYRLKKKINTLQTN